jgi:hypothetical protein
MNVIEKWCKDEYREGVSAGAAARQLCSLLGAYDEAPTLKRILEDILSDANRASFDRSCILRDIDTAAPEDAPRIRRESYIRNNPTAQISGAGQGNN